MHTKYEVSISYGSKVIAKVKVDNRQKDKNTDMYIVQFDGVCLKQLPPIIQSGGIKMEYPNENFFIL